MSSRLTEERLMPRRWAAASRSAMATTAAILTLPAQGGSSRSSDGDDGLKEKKKTLSSGRVFDEKAEELVSVREARKRPGPDLE